MILKFITFLLPWALRRKALNSWFGYEINKEAYIGLAWIFPRKLKMEAKTRIDHFTIAIHIDLIQMEESSIIGRKNWISGFPTKTNSPHFKHQINRKAELILGESAIVTKNHYLDCTNVIEIGKFTTIAGFNSQFLTHSINFSGNFQDSAPIYIGEYSFVGTNSVILLGSVLPAHSILGAKSLLNKIFNEEWTVYGGVPAKMISKIDKNEKYFTRSEGFVY
jgi:hypothetical protein